MIDKSYRNSLILLVISHFLIDLFLGIWPVYKTLAGLDVGKASLIAGICLIIGEPAQLLFGILGTRYTSKLPIIAGLALGGGVALLSHTYNYFLLFLLMFCLYLGSSAFHPAAAGMIGRWSEHPRKMLITLFYIGGTLGAALSQMTFATTWYSFRGGTLIFAIPLILLLCWIHFHTFPKEKKKQNPISLMEIVKELQTKKSILFSLFVIQVVMQSLVVALMFLLPDLLQHRGCSNWLVYGGGYFFFVMGAAVLGLCGGYLANQYAYTKILLFSACGSFCLFYLFLMTTSAATEYLAALLFALGGLMGMTTPLILATSQEFVSPRLRSVISGIFMGGATCFAGLGVVFAGLLSNIFLENSLVKALAFMGCLLLIIPVCIHFLAREGITTARADEDKIVDSGFS